MRSLKCGVIQSSVYSYSHFQCSLALESAVLIARGTIEFSAGVAEWVTMGENHCLRKPTEKGRTKCRNRFSASRQTFNQFCNSPIHWNVPADGIDANAFSIKNTLNGGNCPEYTYWGDTWSTANVHSIIVFNVLRVFRTLFLMPNGIVYFYA